MAGLAWVSRLEDELKYGVIWYKSICQASKCEILKGGESLCSRFFSRGRGFMPRPAM